MALELVRVGRYRARLASSKKDVSAAQALRYQCFNLSNEGKLDIDDFDTICQHVLIENLETEKLVCCYRILSFENGKNISRSYSSQFYDLKVIESYPEPMIEVGRFCIDPEDNDQSVVLTAWAALAKIVDQNQIELLFGCSSFEGIEKEKFYQDYQPFHIATYEENKFVGFIKSDNTWHTVEPFNFDYDRRAIVINVWEAL